MGYVNNLQLDDFLRRALEEDINTGDLTTESIVSPQAQARGSFLVKEEGIIAGLEVIQQVFELLDGDVSFVPLVCDGQYVSSMTTIAEIKGSARALLTGERTGLNLLQRLSGIATLTNRYVKAVAGYKVDIVDTRKTTPGLRMLEKYAVKAGGGVNHRFGLYDAVMIKDNHIVVAGGIIPAVQQVRCSLGHTVKIEVEADNLEQVKEAIAAKADIILLDNMDIETLNKGVMLIDGQAIVEASGGITLETVAAIAQTGVDVISVGALTHSVKALDISLEMMVV